MKIFKITFKNEIDKKNLFHHKFISIYRNKCRIISNNAIHPLEFDISLIKKSFKLILFNDLSKNDLIKGFILKTDDIEIIEIPKERNHYKNKAVFIEFSLNELSQIIYKIKSNNKIKIFGQNFVKNNKNKCFIVYNDEIFPLQEYFLSKDLMDKKANKLELFLIEIENISNKSYMFHLCNSLEEFPLDKNNEDYSKKCIIKNKELLYEYHLFGINKFILTYKLSYKKLKLQESTETSYTLKDSNSRTIFRKKSLPSGISVYNSNLNDSISLPSFLPFQHNIFIIIDMSYMFFKCSSLISLPDISPWNTEKVSNMSNLFNGCSSLISLPDISQWNTTNVSNMSNLFNGCSSLQTLPDLSLWKTDNLTDISYMFIGCKSLKSMPDISNWKTEKVVNMDSVFFGCQFLQAIPNISKWKVDNVKNMKSMFVGCLLLLSLPDISKWNINNVSDISGIFAGCNSVTSLPDISKWNTNKKNLRKLKLAPFSESFLQSKIILASKAVMVT